MNDNDIKTIFLILGDAIDAATQQVKGGPGSGPQGGGAVRAVPPAPRREVEKAGPAAGEKGDTSETDPKYPAAGLVF